MGNKGTIQAYQVPSQLLTSYLGSTFYSESSCATLPISRLGNHYSIPFWSQRLSTPFAVSK